MTKKQTSVKDILQGIDHEIETSKQIFKNDFEAAMDMVKQDNKMINRFYKTKYPLLYAIQKNSTKDVQYLLAHGADPNIRYCGITLFQSMQENSKIVKALLDAGSEIDMRDFGNYETALFEAISRGKRTAIKILLKYNADVFCRNASGKTAMDVAKEKEMNDVYELLQKKAQQNVIFSMLYDDKLDELKKEVKADPEIVKKEFYGKTLLMRAVLNASVEVVKFLISQGADINYKSANGQPLFFMCIHKDDEGEEFYEKYMEILKLLLNDKKLNINATDRFGNTALTIAYYADNEELIDLFLDYKVDYNLENKDGFSILEIFKDDFAKDPLSNTHFKICRSFIKHDLIEYDLPLYILKMKQDAKLDVVRRLIKKDPKSVNRKFITNKEFSIGLLAFDQALEWQLVDIVKELVANKVDIKGALFKVVSQMSYNYEICKFLLEIGCDPNETGYGLYGDSETLLIKAVRYKLFDAVKLLLEYGADINFKSKKGMTVLACGIGGREYDTNFDYDIFKYLLEHGANPNEETQTVHGPDEKVSILMEAVKKAYFKGTGFQAIELLLEHGADIDYKSKSGPTALDVAKEKDFKEAIELLNKYIK